MVEIIPKPVSKPSSWFNSLFYFSVVLLFIAILSIFLLNQFQKKAVLTLKNLEVLLTQIKTQERINLEKELIGYQKKIEDFSFLLQGHSLDSKLFGFLENITHPKVYFSSLNFNSDEKKVILNGETESFQTLGQQLLIFKAEPLVKEVNLSKISIGREGKIDFAFSFSFSPEIFKAR